jgi:hypothetical protein
VPLVALEAAAQAGTAGHRLLELLELTTQVAVVEEARGALEYRPLLAVRVVRALSSLNTQTLSLFPTQAAVLLFQHRARLAGLRLRP